MYPSSRTPIGMRIGVCSQVTVEGREKEEPRQHVASLGSPRDRLDPQRMNGEHKSRKRRAHGKLPGSLMVRHGQSHCQQPAANEIKKYRIGGVKNKISQVISDRVHSPNQVIKPKSHPTQRLVGTHVKRGKHPANLTPSQTAVVRVAYQILVIVPADEIVSQGREKSQKGCQGNEAGNQPQPEVGRSAPYPRGVRFAG